MKIFRVYKRVYNGTEKAYIVAAKNAEKAIVDAKRYIKKNDYDSDPNITKVELVFDVDVYYKS